MLRTLAYFSLQSASTISMLQCSKELGLNAFEATLRDQPQHSLMIRIHSYGLTRCSTFLEREVHVVGKDLSCQPADHVEKIAGTGLFGAIELGQLADCGLDPA